MGGKGDLTKQRLLKKARELFYLNGYNNTSIDDILKASHVKKGNLYFHYRSKEELGFAVLDSYLVQEVEGVDRILNGPGSPLERIYRLFDSFRRNLARVGCRGGCPIGNFALEMADHHNGFRMRINQVFMAWSTRLEEVLKKSIDIGELPPGTDPKALAVFLVALWEGGVMLVKTRKDPRVLKECLKSLKLMLEGPRA